MLKSQIPVLTTTGGLSAATIVVLSEISQVDISLLECAKVLPAKRNLFSMPWFDKDKGGGGMVMGKRIYFTSNWFEQSKAEKCYGDGSLNSTKNWLLLLAHEVRHLEHARVMGYWWVERLAYLVWFGLGYCWFTLVGKKPFTEHMPLEIDADLGRKVLVTLLFDHGEPYENHPLIVAVHQDDVSATHSWLEENKTYLESVKKAIAELH